MDHSPGELFRLLTFAFNHHLCDKHCLEVEKIALSGRGDTELHTTSDIKFAQELLNCCVKSNAKNNFNQTPLHYAILRNDLPMVELLLSHNANPELPDTKRKTPLQLAIEGCNNRNDVSQFQTSSGVFDSSTKQIKIAELVINNSALRRSFNIIKLPPDTLSFTIQFLPIMFGILNDHHNYSILCNYLEKCVAEIKNMKIDKVYCDMTMHTFLKESNKKEFLEMEVKGPILKKSVDYISSKRCRIYSGRMAKALGRNCLLNELLCVYTGAKSNLFKVNNIGILNHDTTILLMGYLSDTDLLNTLVAYRGRHEVR